MNRETDGGAGARHLSLTSCTLSVLLVILYSLTQFFAVVDNNRNRISLIERREKQSGKKTDVQYQLLMTVIRT